MPISRFAGCRLDRRLLACLCVWVGPLCWPFPAIGQEEIRSILFAPLPSTNSSTDQGPRTNGPVQPQPPSSADRDLLFSAFAPLDEEPEVRYNGTPTAGTR